MFLKATATFFLYTQSTLLGSIKHRRLVSKIHKQKKKKMSDEIILIKSS